MRCPEDFGNPNPTSHDTILVIHIVKLLPWLGSPNPLITEEWNPLVVRVLPKEKESDSCSCHFCSIYSDP